MLYFSVDPRDGYMSLGRNGGGGCNTCCCTPLHARPGEVNKITINYAPWSVPLGGRGLTVNHSFALEKISQDGVTGGNQSPVTHFGAFSTALNTVLNESLGWFNSDAENAALTYELLPLYGPANGTIVFNPNGTFTYTPNNGFCGHETIFYEVSDGVSKPVRGELDIVVQCASGPGIPLRTQAQPAVRVLEACAQVNCHMHTLSFPIEVSPAAKPGDIYRLTVRQQAMDCDCNYWHVSCYDIIIGNC